MAIVPLQIKNEIIGSWNNGDVSAERYSPDMDTYFLQKCAQLISMRLAEFTSSSGYKKDKNPAGTARGFYGYR